MRLKTVTVLLVLFVELAKLAPWDWPSTQPVMLAEFKDMAANQLVELGVDVLLSNSQTPTTSQSPAVRDTDVTLVVSVADRLTEAAVASKYSPT